MTLRFFRHGVLVATLVSLIACGTVPVRQKNISDLDNDSVADSEDACPGTVAGTPVTPEGCSIFNDSLAKVDFAPSDHRLNSESRAALAQLVSLLQQHPGVVIRLDGHTDNRGPARDNLELSKTRVMSVVKYMVANGIDGNRLRPFGFGESRPIMSNATEEGRARNRRIEVSVVSQ